MEDKKERKKEKGWYTGIKRKIWQNPEHEDKTE